MYKGTKIRGKRLAFSYNHIRKGSVGNSPEFNVWVGHRFFFLSIGRRYNGKFWLLKGGH